MAKSKVTYDDLYALVEEMEIGSNDTNRTIEDISNKTVKNMVSSESGMAIAAGVTPALLASGAVISGAMIGSIGGAGAGVVSVGISALTVGTASAVAGGATGAAIGSAVPVIGTIVGAGVGIGEGVLTAKMTKEKKKAEELSLGKKLMLYGKPPLEDMKMNLSN